MYSSKLDLKYLVANINVIKKTTTTYLFWRWSMKVRWVLRERGMEVQKVTVQVKEVSLGLSIQTLTDCGYGCR